MNGNNKLGLLLSQARKAAVSRDFGFAEKILLSREVEDIAGPDNPRVLVELGNLYTKAERFEDALSAFKRLYALYPKNTKIINRIGAIYRRMGENEKSLAVLLRAHSLGDKSPELLYNLGNTYKEMHAFESARECFRRALALNRNDTLAYNHIGTIECLMGNYSRALAEYRNGLRCDPNHPFIHFNMARVYRMLGRYEDAEREYIAAIKSRPNWRKALSELSSLYKGDGELEKQAAALDRLLSLDSKNIPALIERAENAEKLKEFDDAREFFLQAVAAAPHNPLPTEKYAHFLSSAGEFEEAAEAIEAYVEDNPGDKSLALDLADAYLEAGREADAEALLKGYAAEPAEEARAWQLSAKLHLARGEKEAARQDIEKVLSGDPQNIGMRKELAGQLAEVGLLEEAKEQLALYSREHPDDPSSDLLLGAICEQEGSFEDALDRYGAVIERERDNMRANAALARLYERMGSGESAVLLDGDSIAAQSAKRGGRDLSMLQESISLYEQAAGQLQMSNHKAAEKNLQALARLQDELKSAAAEALRRDWPGEDEEWLDIEDEGELDPEEALATAPPESEAEGEDNVDIGSLLEALQGADALAESAAEEAEDGDIPQAQARIEPQPPVHLEPQVEAQLGPQIAPMASPAQAGVKARQWPTSPEFEDDDEEEEEEEEEPLPASPKADGDGDIPQVEARVAPQPSGSVEPQPFASVGPQPEAQIEAQIAPMASPAQAGVKARQWPANIAFEDDDEEEEEPLPAAPKEQAEEAKTESGEPPSLFEEEARAASLEVAELGVLELLKYLKDALSFLPQEDQDKYRKSKERIMLEHLISKLSGKPGLHKKGAGKLESGASLQAKEGAPALSETFSLLADLSASLPDKEFAGILGKYAQAVQGKLKSLEEESRLPPQPPQA